MGVAQYHQLTNLSKRSPMSSQVKSNMQFENMPNNNSYQATQMSQ